MFACLGGVLRSEWHEKESREGPSASSSRAKRVLDSIVVEGVDEDVVEQVKVSFSYRPDSSVFSPPDFLLRTVGHPGTLSRVSLAHFCLQEKVAREFGSVDVHAAVRQRVAKEKEAQQLQRQNELSDAWMPDRFYTEELKQVRLSYTPTCATRTSNYGYCGASCLLRLTAVLYTLLQKTPWFNPVEFLNELQPKQREGR